MFLNLLRRNNFFALGFCFVLLLLLWAPRLVAGFAVDANMLHPQIVAQSLWLGLLSNNGWFTLVAFLLTFIGAWFLLFLNNRHMFHSSNEFLLPLLYVLIASAIPSTQWFSGAQVALVFIATGLNFLFFSHHRTPGLAELFTAVFCFSVAALCFPPVLLLLLLMPMGVLTLRSFAWRDWLVLLIAAALPFAYCYLYFWLTTHDAQLSLTAFNVLLPSLPQSISVGNTSLVTFLVAIVLIVLIAIVGGFSRQQGSKVKTFHIRAVFLWMMLFLVSGFIFYPAYNFQLMPLLAFPIAVIAANYFAQPKGRKMKIFCWLILLLAIIYLQLA